MHCCRIQYLLQIWIAEENACCKYALLQCIILAADRHYSLCYVICSRYIFIYTFKLVLIINEEVRQSMKYTARNKQQETRG